MITPLPACLIAENQRASAARRNRTTPIIDRPPLSVIARLPGEILPLWMENDEAEIDREMIEEEVYNESN